MKDYHLKILCDPITRESLTLIDAVYDGEEIISGILVSSSNQFQIINGIPRFVKDEGYSDNFGYQWNRWARIQFEDQNLQSPMQGHTRNMFDVVTGFTDEMLKGKTVLDIGCGPGRFADVALSMGSSVVALDYSSAIDAAKDNFPNNCDILFLQADALKMPLKDDSIDFSYTIGVLHHTPDPAKGVIEAHRVTRPKGKFAIRVYTSDGFYVYPMVKFWRKIFLGLKPLFKHYPPLVYSYTFGIVGYFLGKIWLPLSYPIRALFPTAWLPDLRWTVLDTFDAIATTHQSGHEPIEIENWLSNSGFTHIQQRQGNDFVGTK